MSAVHFIVAAPASAPPPPGRPSRPDDQGQGCPSAVSYEVDPDFSPQRVAVATWNTPAASSSFSPNSPGNAQVFSISALDASGTGGYIVFSA
jgi:hypothetical protein